MLKKLFFISFLFPIIPTLAIPDGEDGESDAGNNDDEKNDDIDNNDDNQNNNDDSQKDERVIFKSQRDFERTLKRRVDKAIKKTKAEEEEKRKKDTMSETEKLKKDLEDSDRKANEAMTKANQRLIKAEVIAKSSSLNIIDSAAAYKLISLDDVEIDEETGEITGVEDALKDLIEDKPYLLKANQNQNRQTGGDDQNAGSNKKKSNFSMNAMIRRAAGKK